MTQNPFGPQNYESQLVVEAPRTSISAIASLVLSLICCIPGFGILATLIGAFAIVRIGSSGGRKSGRFLALAGITLGLLVTAVQVGLFIGAVQLVKNYTINVVTPMSTAFTQLTQGDRSALSAKVDPAVLPTGDKAQMDRFWAEATAKLGAFKGLPDKGFMFQSSNPSGTTQIMPGLRPFPLPLQFAKGDALMFLLVDDKKWMDILFGKISLTGSVQNMVIETEDGTTIYLIPPTGTPTLLTPPTTPPAPPTGGTPPTPPK